MSEQNNTSSDKESIDNSIDNSKDILIQPIPPHYNQWGSGGQCKAETPKKSNNDSINKSINKPKQIYYMDEIGFDTVYLSPW